MSARRFFVEGVHASGDRVTLSDADGHKIAHVLRLRAGDDIDAIDSAGTVFSAQIVTVDPHVIIEIGHSQQAPQSDGIEIDIAQALPKGQKMDFIVEKLTELGVHRIVPFTSERTVVRDAGEAKLGRWRRLAQAAAQQSGRRSIPQVETPVSFDALLEELRAYDVVLFPWEVAAGSDPLRETLPGLVSGARRVLAIIGPEGGFSHSEAERARQAGAHVVSLGGRILRTETAGLVLIAILQYLRS